MLVIEKRVRDRTRFLLHNRLSLDEQELNQNVAKILVELGLEKFIITTNVNFYELRLKVGVCPESDFIWVDFTATR